MRKNLLCFLLTGLFSFGIAGCNGLAYVGNFPLEKSRTYKQRAKEMEILNEREENQSKDSLVILRYRF